MLLVIARKFNDIYYSMSLPEWNLVKERRLIIISNGIPQDAFPHQNKFDVVQYIKYNGESIKNILHVIAYLQKIRIPKSKILVLSNPVLVANQYIIKHSNPSSVVFIEDGSMNYTNFSPSKNIAKKLLQLSLGIVESRVFKRIGFTYLFYPEKATFYFGLRKKLTLRKEILPVNDKLKFIEGKKVLVGQPLYTTGYLSLERYNEIVNQTIRQLGIDLYVPHAFSSDKEDIQCEKLLLNEFNVTLEAIAASHSFVIYSYGSTVLYSCKTINPEVCSVLLTVKDKGMEKLDTRFIRTFCNKVVEIK